MLKTPGPQPRILVTNDDGVNAEGLEVLERLARAISEDVWVVAPEIDHTGAGHSLTLRRPLRVRKVAERRFAVDGTPTDCVMLGLQNILDGEGIDLVLSGINHGSNLGEDMTYSGTIAAAMEATMLRVPSIAFSQACNESELIDWRTAELYTPDLVRRLLPMEWPEDVLININFPACSPEEVRGHLITSQGKRKLGDELIERIDPRGRPYIWVGLLRTDDELKDGTDLAAVRDGFVSITPIHLNLTHHESLGKLHTLFNQS